MHTLTVTPVSDLVLAGPNRVQPGLPQSMLPNFVKEWKRPGKRTSWQNFFDSLPPQYQDKARQDYMEHRSNPTPTAPVEDPVAEPTVPTAVPEPGAMGDQDEFSFMESPQQFLQRVREGVNQFGRQFNIQTIRPYNNAIQHALRAVKSLSQQPDISPDVRERGDQLLQLFQQIQAGDAEDAQLVQQLGQLAHQLGQSAGAYQPGAASNIQTRDPFARAASNLTAEAGSASYLLQ